MRVFVTGATGYVGSAVVRELIDAGHEVLGLARSDEAAAKLTAAGADVHGGALDDLDSLRRGAEAVDGVIHMAFVHDFSDYEGAGETDLRAVETLGGALEGTGRPFVVTTGTALLTPGRTGAENDPPDPGSAASVRIPSERAAMGLAARGVRTSAMRLPPTVHGDGDHGFVPAAIDIARSTGVSAYIGDGTNRWPAVHRLDAARLYRLALEAAPAATAIHAVAEEGVPTRAIAGAIGQLLDLPVISVSAAEAGEHFGWLASFLAYDNPTSSALTRARLGWEPVQPGLIEDLERGVYLARAPARAG